MPSKAEFYRQMAEQVSTQLVGSWKEWTAFLSTAARLYKYPFHEQMMIYAQRPNRGRGIEIENRHEVLMLEILLRIQPAAEIGRASCRERV